MAFFPRIAFPAAVPLIVIGLILLVLAFCGYIRPSKLVIALLWLFLVVDAIHEGWTLPLSGLAQSWAFADDNWSATVTLVFPFATIIFAFRETYVPPSIWKPKAVSGFLIRLKLELLVACYGLLSGSIGFIRSIQLDAPKGAFVMSGFFFDAGIAVGVTFFVLRRRGLLKQESISPPTKT
jgi:hypothetical protein